MGVTKCFLVHNISFIWYYQNNLFCSVKLSILLLKSLTSLSSDFKSGFNDYISFIVFHGKKCSFYSKILLPKWKISHCLIIENTILFIANYCYRNALSEKKPSKIWYCWLHVWLTKNNLIYTGPIILYYALNNSKQLLFYKLNITRFYVDVDIAWNNNIIMKLIFRYFLFPLPSFDKE